MSSTATRLTLVVLAVGVAWAAIAWPRINDVQTGHTPEYPDGAVRGQLFSTDRY